MSHRAYFKGGLAVFTLIVLVVGGMVFAPSRPPKETLAIGAKSWTIIGKATTEQERALGLSHRQRLPVGSGLLFVFPEAGQYSFWMKDMYFPIDIIFIRAGTVDSVAKNREPGDLTPIPPVGPITHVFEVNAGEGERIKPGDRVYFK